MTRSEAMNIYVTLNENEMLIHATLWLNSMFGFLITETNIHTDETVMWVAITAIMICCLQLFETRSEDKRDANAFI